MSDGDWPTVTRLMICLHTSSRGSGCQEEQEPELEPGSWMGAQESLPNLGRCCSFLEATAHKGGFSGCWPQREEALSLGE